MLRLSKLLVRTSCLAVAKEVRPTLKIRFRFSKIDKIFNKLNKPAYYYIIGANVCVYLAWQADFINKVIDC
jgi:hypothetical protein